MRSKEEYEAATSSGRIVSESRAKELWLQSDVFSEQGYLLRELVESNERLRTSPAIPKEQAMGPHNAGCGCVSCEHRRERLWGTAAAFGKVYAYLDTIRSLAREASAAAGPTLEQKYVDEIDRIVDQANLAIGSVLDASKRSAAQNW
jgi:hypothetical protein